MLSSVDVRLNLPFCQKNFPSLAFLKRRPETPVRGINVYIRGNISHTNKKYKNLNVANTFAHHTLLGLTDFGLQTVSFTFLQLLSGSIA